MDNAHPSRNGTIQLIVAVILTKPIILYCSYLYPHIQDFCAVSLVHGMMSSFYTVYVRFVEFSVHTLAPLQTILVCVFPSLHNRHYWFPFFRRESKRKVSEKCQKCPKREGVIFSVPSAICMWHSSLTSPLPTLARKTLKNNTCYVNDNRELTITEYLIKFDPTSNDFQ